MSENNELRIRMTIDNSDAEKKLDDFGRSADKATNKATAGTKEFERETRKAAGGVDSMKSALGGANQEIASLIKAQVGLGAVRGFAEAIGAEWRRVADDIGKSSREWQKFRASLQGVASLEGKTNTNAFAVSEIDRAERAHVTPEEMQRFRESFLSKASLYIGEGPNAKLGTKDADLFQERLAEYGAAKGVSPAEMAGFAGGLLSQQKGKTTAADMMSQAGKVFATLEASSAPVSHLLPMMTRVQAQGFTAEQSAQLLAQAPEYAPEEEGTYILRAVSALRERIQKGQGDEFGLKKGMEPYQVLTTAVKNIQARAAKGEDLDDLLTMATGGEEVSGRALRGLVNQGGEGFARWRKVLESTPADQLDRAIQDDRQSEAGRHRAVTSRLAVEQARMGLRGDAVEHRRQIAEAELTANRDFERVHWGQLPAEALRLAGADDMRGRLINQQAIGRARAELGEGVSASDKAASLYGETTNQLLRELISRIEAQHKTQEETAQILKNRNGGSVPPPMGGKPSPVRTRP